MEGRGDNSSTHQPSSHGYGNCTPFSLHCEDAGGTACHAALHPLVKCHADGAIGQPPPWASCCAWQNGGQRQQRQCRQQAAQQGASKKPQRFTGVWSIASEFLAHHDSLQARCAARNTWFMFRSCEGISDNSWNLALCTKPRRILVEYIFEADYHKNVSTQPPNTN